MRFQKYSSETEQITAEVVQGTYAEMQGNLEQTLRMWKHACWYLLMEANQLSCHKVLGFQIWVQEFIAESVEGLYQATEIFFGLLIHLTVQIMI